MTVCVTSRISDGIIRTMSSVSTTPGARCTANTNLSTSNPTKSVREKVKDCRTKAPTVAYNVRQYDFMFALRYGIADGPK